MRMTREHWSAIQARLKEKVGDASFESWLAPLDLDAERATLQDVVVRVPTRFIRDWVIRHYNQAITDTVREVLGGEPTLNFTIAGTFTVPDVTHTPAAAKAPTPHAAEPTDAPSLTGGNMLNPHYTFDSFVTGKSNEFAYAAAKRIAESDDILYNPFLLYGGVGLGKTHLMHGIAWFIQKNYPQRRVLYISSEKFVFQFIRSLRDKKTIDFKETFRSVDVLMIDDIQFIAGKEATQEEFFHTLNALMDMRKQVVLTADRSPHEMDNVEDRLRSRLSSGLITEIHRPNLETRIAILERKAEERGITLPRDVALFLADRIASNVRELEGALNRLVAHTQLTRQSITLDNTQDLLKDIFQAYGRQVTLDQIQMKVAEHFHIKLQDMHSNRRTKDVARPRQVAMYLAKQLTSKSYPEIGKAFGGRDHTTVMHAVKTVDALRAKDPSIAEDLKLLEGLLTG